MHIITEFFKYIVNNMPSIVTDRLSAEKVGNHPLTTSRNLSSKVCITGSSKACRSVTEDIRVTDDYQRSRAGKCLLCTILNNR